jgi:hypothetical protein
MEQKRRALPSMTKPLEHDWKFIEITFEEMAFLNKIWAFDFYP